MSKPNLSLRVDPSVFALLEKLAKEGFAESVNGAARNLLYSKIKEDYGLDLPVQVFDKMIELEKRLQGVEKQIAAGITLRKKSKDQAQE